MREIKWRATAFICKFYGYLSHAPCYDSKRANYFEFLTQVSTTSLGIGPDGRDIYVPLKDLLPMLNPNDIEFDGNPN